MDNDTASAQRVREEVSQRHCVDHNLAKRRGFARQRTFGREVHAGHVTREFLETFRGNFPISINDASVDNGIVDTVYQSHERGEIFTSELGVFAGAFRRAPFERRNRGCTFGVDQAP